MLKQPQCSIRRCIHLMDVFQPDGTEKDERPACRAFPRGIPDEIAYGNNPHTEPFPGDGGILYELDPDAEPPEPDEEEL